jgi:hypothetical protein
MVKYHFGNNPVYKNNFSGITILNKITTQIGGELPTHLEFRWDENNTIEIIPKTGNPQVGEDNVDYSVCLFQGINILDNFPDSFELIRALTRDNMATVVFRTSTNGITGHFYDVSNELP